ncbi:MAG: tetratricopeptide repeat protein [Candidatus Hydrogenedentota bacterium]
MASSTTHDTDAPLEGTSGIKSIIKNVQENPGMYIASVVIVLGVFIGSALFRLNTDLEAQEQASVYAEAMDVDDPTERIAALGVVADSGSKYAAEARYLQGFTAMDAEDYATAEIAFTDLRENNADFEFTPDALEGLGTIREIEGDYAGAVSVYTEIMTTWPDSFAARRQPFNIGQCHEKNGAVGEAVKAYQEQLAKFPGSYVAQRAEVELNRLQAEDPGLDTESDLLTVVE